MSEKIGEGHLAAMTRLGLKELRNALNPSRESAADYEIGLYGTATQGEIANARGEPGMGAEQESLADIKGLDDLRAYAREHAQSQDRTMEASREHGQDRDQNGHER